MPGLKGVLWMEGEEWKRHTLALKPVFHGANFGRYAQWMARTAKARLDAAGGGWEDGQRKDVLAGLRELATTVRMQKLLLVLLLVLTSLIQVVMAAGYGVDPGP